MAANVWHFPEEYQDYSGVRRGAGIDSLQYQFPPSQRRSGATPSAARAAKYARRFNLGCPPRQASSTSAERVTPRLRQSMMILMYFSVMYERRGRGGLRA